MRNNNDIYDRAVPVALFNGDRPEPVGRDCDCACPETCLPEKKTTLQHLINEGLTYECSPHLIEPVNDTFYAVLTRSSQTFGLLNRPAVHFLKSFEKGAAFREVAHRWKKAIDEKNALELFGSLVHHDLLLPEPYAEPPVQHGLSSITAWIHLTEQCNLNCSYCYLKKENKYMAVETGNYIIQKLFQTARQNDCKKVIIKYAGGEPLLNFVNLKEIHRFALDYSKKTKIAIEGVVLSNALFLSKDKIDFLKETGLGLMTSLDGTKEFNDLHRYKFNNTGTYEKVVKNIENAVKSGIAPQISVTLSNANAKGLPALVEWLIERALKFNINLYRTNSHSTLSSKMDNKLLTESILDAFEIIRQKLPLKHSLLSIIDRSNLSFPHRYTCGVGLNYLVFDCDGNLASCHMKIGQSISRYPHHNDLLSIVRKNSTVQNLPVEQKEGCNSCRWKYWCTSGCPLNTYHTTNRFDVKSPYCEVYKNVFPQLVKLEGLRLLRNRLCN